MLPDLIPRLSARFVVSIYLDDPTVGQEFEVMFRVFMRKAHCVVSAQVHGGVMHLRCVLEHWARRLSWRLAGHVLAQRAQRLVFRVSCRDD